MAAKALPSQAVLNQLLRYDPETGKLFWKERGLECFNAGTEARARSLCSLWNARYSGREAFTCEEDGYRTGSINGSNYKAHRVIWKMVTGEDPDHIDHEFGKRNDNRIAKLADVSISENAKNRRVPRNNKSCVIGVCLWKQGRYHYWAALIGSKTRYFHSFDDAVTARRAAEIEHGFHQNHGRST